MTTDTAQGNTTAAQGASAADTSKATDTQQPDKTALSQGADAVKTADNKDSQNSQAQDKPEGSDAKDADKQDTDKDKAEGAPEKYDDFTLPENMEVNPEVLGKFSEMAKGANMPQAKAQEFVALGAELVTEAVENYHASITDAYAKKVEGWHDTRIKDPEIGGTEEAQKQVLASASKTVRALGGDALIKALDETGAGNHPEIIRAFYKIKDFVGEDGKLIVGNLGGSGEVSAAKALYPNLPTTS